MIAFSGVRSSWDMLARNCDLCWLASASWRVRLLELLEQPGVLDGDDGLVGERLQQRDLPSVNGLHLLRAMPSDADRLALTHERQSSSDRVTPPVDASGSRGRNFVGASVVGTWIVRRIARRPDRRGPIGERGCRTSR